MRVYLFKSIRAHDLYAPANRLVLINTVQASSYCYLLRTYTLYYNRIKIHQPIMLDLIGVSLSEPHTSDTTYVLPVCTSIYVSTYVCVRRCPRSPQCMRTCQSCGSIYFQRTFVLRGDYMAATEEGFFELKEA